MGFFWLVLLFWDFFSMFISCALGMDQWIMAKCYEQAIISSPTNLVLFSLWPLKTKIEILGGFFWLMACLLCCFLCDLQCIWWSAVCWILRFLFMGFFPPEDGVNFAAQFHILILLFSNYLWGPKHASFNALKRDKYWIQNWRHTSFILMLYQLEG